MEQINFHSRKFIKSERKENERGLWLLSTSEKLGKPIGQVGSLTKGFDAAGLRSLYLSSEGLSKDKGLPFSQAWFWHLNEIKKQLKESEMK